MAPIFWESSAVPEFWNYINNGGKNKNYYYQFYKSRYPDIPVSEFILNAFKEKMVPVLFIRDHENIESRYSEIMKILKSGGYQYLVLKDEKISIYETFRLATIDRHSANPFYDEKIILIKGKIEK